MSANSERDRFDAWWESDGKNGNPFDLRRAFEGGWQAAISSPHTPPAVEAPSDEILTLVGFMKRQASHERSSLPTRAYKYERIAELLLAAPPAPAVEPVALTDARIKEVFFGLHFTGLIGERPTASEERAIVKAILAAAQEGGA